MVGFRVSIKAKFKFRVSGQVRLGSRCGKC
jgi:hypothetical protein